MFRKIAEFILSNTGLVVGVFLAYSFPRYAISIGVVALAIWAIFRWHIITK